MVSLRHFGGKASYRERNAFANGERTTVSNCRRDGRTEYRGENALFLARSTWNELRELMFQVHDPEIAHTDLQALLNGWHSEREWNYHMEQDPSWSSAGYVFRLFSRANGSDV